MAALVGAPWTRRENLAFEPTWVLGLWREGLNQVHLANV
jgi:hypothetical protein